MNSLKEKYESTIKNELMTKFNYSSVMEVPKLEKIVVNIGVGEASHDLLQQQTQTKKLSND